MTDVDKRDRSAALPRGVQGAADANFACTLRGFAQLFPGRRFGGGALSVYQNGQPLVDIWAGYSDRRGTQYWTADGRRPPKLQCESGRPGRSSPDLDCKPQRAARPSQS